MAIRLSPNWMDARIEEIEKHTFASATLSFNKAAQWLILQLDSRNLPVKVVNLGAGVKKISLQKNICPTCGGKGWVK